MKVLSAHLGMMLDKPGRRYANGPQLHVVVDEQPDDREFKFSFIRKEKIDDGLFYAEHDGWWRTHFHDGTNQNNGGYSGHTFHVKMADGTDRSIKGPWMGSPGAAKEFGLPQLIDVTIHEGSAESIGLYGYWISVEKAIEILKLVSPVEGEGSLGFQASLVLLPAEQISGYTFAITKISHVYKGMSGTIQL